MDIGEFRTRLQQELEQASPGQDVGQVDLGAAIAAFRDPAADPQRRAAALDVMVIELSKRQDLIDLVIAVLRDRAAPAVVRHAALSALRTASFRVAVFAPMRPAYLDALRSIVDDPDAALRTQAMEILAQEKDEYVQRRLLQGLRDHSAALVPAERAVEFLGYDVHADHFPLLRSLARESASPVVRQKAIRLLGADASSSQLLQDVLTDRNEDADVRTASAAALQALAPADFARLAAQIVVDHKEDDRLRAASVAALDHFQESTATPDDPSFLERVRTLQSIGSEELQRAARRFVAKRSK